MNCCAICGSGFALNDEDEEYCPVCSSPASMGDVLRIEPQEDKAQTMRDLYSGKIPLEEWRKL